MNRPPQLGDVVALPAWLPDRAYRVLATRDPGIDGQIWIGGYIIDQYPRTETWHLVPVSALQRLPDPTFGEAP